ncbi:MAG TPA: sulfite exporter TauE/SafE family protein [Mycobacteriales bacterium]|nr:sulfite exporter TauE/SafE family protein [Mycobacteriales bacterium]
MQNLLAFVVVGFGAQLVDGALGMAFGVTASTLLLVNGVTPALASASVHLAELGTSLASGASHWRFRNVDWRLVARLGVPGSVGAFVGATVLSSVSTQVAAPWTASVLLLLGAYVLVRFSLRAPAVRLTATSPHRRRFLTPLGLTAGFVDATGGGGWGPVSTSTLLSAGRVAPRQVVGSVDTSEFLVAAAASVGFVIGLRGQGISAVTVLGMLVGGVLAAPLAAWLVRRLPVAVLGTGVGGILVLTNARTLLTVFGVTGGRTAVYVAIVIVWAVMVLVAVAQTRRGRVPLLDAAPA